MRKLDTFQYGHTVPLQYALTQWIFNLCRQCGSLVHPGTTTRSEQGGSNPGRRHGTLLLLAGIQGPLKPDGFPGQAWKIGENRTVVVRKKPQSPDGHVWPRPLSPPKPISRNEILVGVIESITFLYRVC